MTSAEIANQLRAARPIAPAQLRLQVLARAAAPAPVPQPRLGWLRRRRLVLLVPAAATLATVAAVAIAVGNPTSQPEATDTTRSLKEIGTNGGTVAPNTAAPPAGVTSESPTAPTQATDQAARLKADDRAQDIVASLALRVPDGDALSTAVRDAVRITRSLDGYVVTSDVASGDDGGAALSLRVPAANAQDAIGRLSELGTIVTQRVQATDLQGQLDALSTELVQLHTSLARVRARLASDELTTDQRALLQARRDQLIAQIRQAQAQRGATTAQAAEATIDLTLTTAKASGIVVPASRLDRTLTRALDVLAWEAVTVFGLLVVFGPIALAFFGLRHAHRSARRWSETRTLGAS